MNATLRLNLGWLEWLMVLLLLGYLVMSRTFAHIGYAPLYIGELALAAAIARRPLELSRPWFGSLSTRSPLSGVSWWLYIFFGYGAIELLRGLLGNPYTKTALENLAFNVYALFFLVGLWLGRRHPELLRRFLHWMAWANGIYGVLYLAIFARSITMETILSGEVESFGQPHGSAVALVALVCYERDLRKVWVPMVLNGFVLLGLQLRAEWLGFLVCLPVLGYLTGRLTQVFKLSAVVCVLLAVGWITDFSIPAPEGRGGRISARYVVGRAIAAVDERAASSIIRDAGRYAGTVRWRSEWWGKIWDRVHEGPVTAVFGLGYGYPIWDFHPEGLDQIIRTPHSAFMYALAYTGWLGVVIFFGLQASLCFVLWRVYRRTGQPFGICFWTVFLVRALFDNFLGTPFGAIPFYLICGMAAAPLLAAGVVGAGAAGQEISEPSCESS